MNAAELKQKSIAMVEAFIEGYRICGIGGCVYKFKPGAEDSGRSLMLCGDAVECRDWLYQHGIKMERIDSGGSPEWHFGIAA